jgi:hypothetical protein
MGKIVCFVLFACGIIVVSIAYFFIKYSAKKKKYYEEFRAGAAKIDGIIDGVKYNFVSFSYTPHTLIIKYTDPSGKDTVYKRLIGFRPVDLLLESKKKGNKVPLLYKDGVVEYFTEDEIFVYSHFSHIAATIYVMSFCFMAFCFIFSIYIWITEIW